MTLIHTFATIFFLLGVIAHLAALILKVNRPLVKSIFTGEVDLEYVRDRHTLWYEEMIRQKMTGEKAEDEVEVKGECEKEKREEREAIEPSPEIESKEEEDKMASVVKVKGMSCQHCVMAVTKALGQLEGVQKVEVDLPAGEVRFENTKAVPQEEIEKAIIKAGYQVVRG